MDEKELVVVSLTPLAFSSQPFSPADTRGAIVPGLMVFSLLRGYSSQRGARRGDDER